MQKVPHLISINYLVRSLCETKPNTSRNLGDSKILGDYGVSNDCWAYNVSKAQERNNGFGAITTEIKNDIKFYFAEDYHQQYLAKPGSRPYCSAMPTKVIFKNFSGSNFKLNQKIWSNYNWEIKHCILRGENTPIQIET